MTMQIFFSISQTVFVKLSGNLGQNLATGSDQSVLIQHMYNTSLRFESANRAYK